MAIEYSFERDRSEFIMDSIVGIVPGLHRMVMISSDQGEIRFLEYDQESGFINMELADRPYAYKLADKLRTDRAAYQWIGPRDVPFIEFQGQEDGRRDIFSEVNNRILLLRLPNARDHKSDLILLAFRSNLSHFGLANVDTQLTTDHKAIIGNLLSNTIGRLSRNWETDRKRFEELTGSMRQVTARHEADHSELVMLKENYGESLVALCRTYLRELSEQYDQTFVYTDDALQRIAEFKGNLQTLKLIIADAVSFLSQMHFQQDVPDIKVHGWDLNFNKFSVVHETKGDVIKMDSRESRALLLLDKLERAALDVLRNHLPLTSANVGASFPTPITAPAISDALKKNRSKILKVLERYPEKWTTIRYQFRPLKNILDVPGRQEGDEAVSV